MRGSNFTVTQFIATPYIGAHCNEFFEFKSFFHERCHFNYRPGNSHWPNSGY